MTLGGTTCSWGWCMFSIYYKETHCRLHLSCHVTTDLRLLPIGASRWPWCPNGILLGSPIWIPFTFTIMYYVHMWCAVFSSCLYISLSCILSILFLFTLRYFLIWVLDSKRGQKVFLKPGQTGLLFLFVSLSPSLRIVLFDMYTWAMIWNSGNQSQKGNPPDGGFPCHLVEQELLLWIQHWQIMQIFLNWVETTTEKMTLSI